MARVAASEAGASSSPGAAAAETRNGRTLAPGAASAKEGEPVDAELLRDRGVLLERMGETAGARADFEAGLAALRAGDPPALVEDLRRKCQREP